MIRIHHQQPLWQLQISGPLCPGRGGAASSLGERQEEEGRVSLRAPTGFPSRDPAQGEPDSPSMEDWTSGQGWRQEGEAEEGRSKERGKQTRRHSRQAQAGGSHGWMGVAQRLGRGTKPSPSPQRAPTSNLESEPHGLYGFRLPRGPG